MKTTATTTILRKPKDGESALYIDCLPDSFTYPSDSDGLCTQNITNTVTVRLMYGTTQVANYFVEVCSTDDSDWYTEDTYANQGGDVYVRSIERSGNDTIIKIYVEEDCRYADDNAWVQVRMTTRIDGKEVSVTKQIDCYAQRRGVHGAAGAVMRGPQAWTDCAVGYSFKAGGEDEEWKDVVLYEGQFYSCVTSHVKTASNYPLSREDTNGGYWKSADKMEMVATKILLSQYALVKNLGVEVIDMKDEKGNIIFQAKDGNVICNKGTFKNIQIAMGGAGMVGGNDCPIWVGGGSANDAVFKVDKSGRLQANTIGYDISLPPPIDDKCTSTGALAYIYEKDADHEQLGVAQLFTLETSVLVIHPNINDFDNAGLGQVDNLFFCIPLASEVGKLNLEIYVSNPTVFKNVSYAPDVFICQGASMTTPTDIDNGLCCDGDVTIYSYSGGGAQYTILDPGGIEQFISTQYFPSEASTGRSLGTQYGYIEMKRYQGALPHYLRLLSDGKSWYLMEYRY